MPTSKKYVDLYREVQKLLDKLAAQMEPAKHEIFARIIKANYKGMTKQALQSLVALSKYTLVDYNWNLNVRLPLRLAHSVI